MPNYGNYRRPCIGRRPWMYFVSYMEAYVVGDPLAEEGIVTGPIQVRCGVHGWAPAGIGDECAHCYQELVEAEVRQRQEDYYGHFIIDPDFGSK